MKRKRTALGLGSLVIVCLLAWAISQAQPGKSSTKFATALGTKPLAPYAQATPNRAAADFLHARLSVNPQAHRFRRRLGARFLAQGQIATDIVALLAIGAQRQNLRIRRSFDETGENVTIVVTGAQANLQWSDRDGAVSNGTQATGEMRALIERLALDSPDQFVLAQLRRAAYRTIAEAVRPEESISTDKNEIYTGPLWTLVQVLETGAGRRPLSAVRQYYINQKTGLLDRVLSQENGKTISAELAGWVERNGETFPSVITWQSGSEELMKLTVNNIGFVAQQ